MTEAPVTRWTMRARNDSWHSEALAIGAKTTFVREMLHEFPHDPNLQRVVADSLRDIKRIAGRINREATDTLKTLDAAGLAPPKGETDG